MNFFKIVSLFFFLYLLCYASFLFFSVIKGAWKLYYDDKKRRIKNELKHEFYFPVSILVPCYNEEVTILDSIDSLLNLDYKLYEIIIVDDGSTDNTSKKIIEYFHLKKVNHPIRKVIDCKKEKAVYESNEYKVKLTLICKDNGGKGDALNMGINVSQYPYFLCIDADSLLQENSLERIVQPVLENDDVVAVGGLIRPSQGVEIEKGKVKNYHLPWNIITSTQAVEYARSFLASRIFLDSFNGNLIISGAFGLFRKDIVIAVNGYDTQTVGEDMELVVKIHTFCINNKIPYRMRYAADAVCWSQVPESIGDLFKQRRRWHTGLFQCMMKYKHMFLKPRFGGGIFFSYLYLSLYELFSPIVKIFGITATFLAYFNGLLDMQFMVRFLILYIIYGAFLTITAFEQRIYAEHLKMGAMELLKACVMCVLETVFFKPLLEIVRFIAIIRYKKNGIKWEKIKRSKHYGAIS